MALADAISTVSADIASTLDGLPKGEDQSAEAWEVVLTKIAAWIAANGVVAVTIDAGTINTAGTAAAQTGPISPVPLTGGMT